MALQETTLDLSAGLFRDCPGLAMDIGGSVAKIVYRAKADWEEFNNAQAPSTGKLRLLSCARTEVSQALDKVKAEAYISRDGNEPTGIFTCGIGCSQLMAQINKTLNIKLINVNEAECFVNTFNYLTKRYSPAVLLREPCQKQIDTVMAQMEQMMSGDSLENFKKHTSLEFDLDKDWKGSGPVTIHTVADKSVVEVLGDSMYPCMMAMLGSAFAMMEVAKDGSYKFSDMSMRGGRLFLGLSSLLLNTKDYPEIIDLAEKGDQYKVNMSQRAFVRETEGTDEAEDDMYQEWMKNEDIPEQCLFGFGHAVGKNLSDFKREDLAAALLFMLVSDAVQTIHKSAILSRTQHVFVCGSFTNRTCIREMFTKEWMSRNMNAIFMDMPVTPTLHFMTQGSHLGALGAFINNIEHFFNKDGTINRPEPKSNDV